MPAGVFGGCGGGQEAGWEHDEVLLVEESEWDKVTQSWLATGEERDACRLQQHVRINYRVEGLGPPLVLQHGFSGAAPSRGSSLATYQR